MSFTKQQNHELQKNLPRTKRMDGYIHLWCLFVSQYLHWVSLANIYASLSYCRLCQAAFAQNPTREKQYYPWINAKKVPQWERLRRRLRETNNTSTKYIHSFNSNWNAIYKKKYDNIFSSIQFLFVITFAVCHSVVAVAHAHCVTKRFIDEIITFLHQRLMCKLSYSMQCYKLSKMNDCMWFRIEW